MTKVLYALSVLTFTCLLGKAQFVEVSGDGRYFLKRDKDNLLIKSTDGKWEKNLVGNFSSSNIFSSDSKMLFAKVHDSLLCINLGTNDVTCTKGVLSFKIENKGANEWLTYKAKADKKLLVMQNLSSSEFYQFSNAEDYEISPNGTFLLLKSSDSLTKQNKVDWVNLSDRRRRAIWSGSGIITNFAFNTDGDKLAFVVETNRSNKPAYSIWYFHDELPKSECIITDESKVVVENQMVVGNSKSILRFTPDGNKILFDIERPSLNLKANPDFPNVDIWSYLDPLIYSQQLRLQKQFEENKDHYVTVINVNDRKSIRLLRENESVINLGDHSNVGNPNTYFPQITNNNILIFKFRSNVYQDYFKGIEGYVLSEYLWSKATIVDVYLESLIDGTRKLVAENLQSRTFPRFVFSPDGNYILYYDKRKASYFSYDILKSQKINLSKTVSVSWNRETGGGHVADYFEENTLRPYSSIWINNKSILLKDHYGDIWNFDVTGQVKPFSVTNGFFATKKLVLVDWCLNAIGYLSNRSPVLINKNIGFLYSINELDYKVTYWQCDLNKKTSPQKLANGGDLYSFADFRFRSIGNDNLYLFSFETKNKPKTFYYTLNHFNSIVSIGGKDVNINSDEIINKEILQWKTFDGGSASGILYKPQHFDNKKKYPIIFNYYEQEASQNINRFERYNEKPDHLYNVIGANIPVEQYLRAGYLVFIPNIYYKTGFTGKSVYNVVVSAAELLSKRSYVNSKKMGICGHSFGGYETNYLIAHSNIFAAACSGSGVSDIISSYLHNEDDLQGYSFQEALVIGQFRIGVNPWERPDIYLSNSAIFYADRVKTPLLIMANENDTRVPYGQGIELFKALRRLGKKCWLVQYDGEGHVLGDKKSGIDWGKRMFQFFEHYLKDAYAPVWMTLLNVNRRPPGGVS